MQTWDKTTQDGANEYIDSLNRAINHGQLYLNYHRQYNNTYTNNILKIPSPDLYGPDPLVPTNSKWFPSNQAFFNTFINSSWKDMVTLWATNQGYSSSVATTIAKLIENRNFNFASQVTPLADGRLYKDNLTYSAYSSFNFINYRDTDITYPDNDATYDYYGTIERRNEIHIYSPVHYDWDGVLPSTNINFGSPAAHIVRDSTITIGSKTNWRPHELYYNNLWYRPVNGSDDDTYPLHSIDFNYNCPVKGTTEGTFISKLVKCGYSIGAKNKNTFLQIAPYLTFNFNQRWDSLYQNNINPGHLYDSSLNFPTPDPIDRNFQNISQWPFNVPRSNEKFMIVFNTSFCDFVVERRLVAYPYTASEYSRTPICSPQKITTFTFAPSLIAKEMVPYDTNWNF